MKKIACAVLCLMLVLLAASCSSEPPVTTVPNVMGGGPEEEGIVFYYDGVPQEIEVAWLEGGARVKLPLLALAGTLGITAERGESTLRLVHSKGEKTLDLTSADLSIPAPEGVSAVREISEEEIWLDGESFLKLIADWQACTLSVKAEENSVYLQKSGSITLPLLPL